MFGSSQTHIDSLLFLQEPNILVAASDKKKYYDLLFSTLPAVDGAHILTKVFVFTEFV